MFANPARWSRAYRSVTRQSSALQAFSTVGNMAQNHYRRTRTAIYRALMTSTTDREGESREEKVILGFKRERETTWRH